jgi:hypothetical protein
MSSRTWGAAVLASLVALGGACSYQGAVPPGRDAAALEARPADAGPDRPADAPAADAPGALPPGPDAGGDGALEAPAAEVSSDTAPAPPTAEQIAFGCPPDPELRGCYSFDEPGAMMDGSGRGNHMMRNTAQWVNDGVRGGTLRFTTGRQFAVIPDAPSLRLAGSEATFEAWIRPTMSSGTDGGADTIASKFSAAFTGWSFATYDHEVRLYTTGTANQAAGTFLDRKWTHVAVVLSQGGVDLFLDGLKRNPAPLAPLTMTGNQESVTVGGLDPVNLGALPPERFAFFGDIDVLRIYGRPRRAEEICADAGRAFAAGSCRPGSAPPP